MPENEYVPEYEGIPFFSQAVEPQGGFGGNQPPEMFSQGPTLNAGGGPVDWISSVASSLGGDVAESIAGLFGSTNGQSEYAKRQGFASSEGGARAGGGSDGESFFDKIKKGAGRAWDKDPGKVLELALGAVGGAYKDDQARKAADALRRAPIEAQERYTASFGTTKRAAAANKPLARHDGTRVFKNGVIKG